MFYYGVISLCSVMFSMQFFFNQMFQKSYGSDFRAGMVQSAGSALMGVLILSLMSGFHCGYTHFSFLMAIIVAVVSALSAFCALKAFEKISFSLYSTFMMLGGMVLPFVAGILFYNEALTIGKCICFIFITAAIFLTVERGGNRKGIFYGICVFLLNGLFAVLSKVYTDAPFEKVSAYWHWFLYLNNTKTSISLFIEICLFTFYQPIINLSSSVSSNKSIALSKIAFLLYSFFWLCASLPR